jgi:arylsulfatase A-like enzyme
VEDPWFSLVDRPRLPRRIAAPGGAAGKPAILEGIRERQGLRGFSEARWNELRAAYLGMCARTDHMLGKIVEALKEAGMYDDTALFFFSDHGDFTGDYGLVEKTQNTFEDCLTRVPLVVKPPAWTGAKPGISEALVELVDFRATVEDLCGFAPDREHFGRSLVPLIQGKAREHRQAVFCEGGRRPGEAHCTENDYLEMEDGHKTLYWPRLSLECEEGRPFLHGKAAMWRSRQHKLVRRLYEPDELYDLEADPGETRSVAADPAYAPVLERMRGELLNFMMETADLVPRTKDRRT